MRAQINQTRFNQIRFDQIWIDQGCDRDLHRETGATFGTTRINDRTATLGFHTGAKAMGTFATNGRRLISTFHDYLSES